MPSMFAVGDLVADTYTPSLIGSVIAVDTCHTWGESLATCHVAFDTIFGGTHISQIDSRRLLPATPGYIDAMTPGYTPRIPTADPPVNNRRIRLHLHPFALVS